MSGSSQVIRATQMFTKDGTSKKVSLVREIATGFSLGIAFGLIWKVRRLVAPLDVGQADLYRHQE